MSISPDLAFVLTLLLRMAVTAAFVVTASIITERSGPLIGALVATLPVFTGPVYVFLALDHDNAFIAASALAALPINAVIMAFGMIYAMMAQRHSAVASQLLPAPLVVPSTITQRASGGEFFAVMAGGGPCGPGCFPAPPPHRCSGPCARAKSG